MRIDIFSDTICPWCFIGKRRLERALEDYTSAEDLEIHWRAFQLNPEMPQAGMDRRLYLETKFGTPRNAAAIYDRVASAGAEEGIAFNFGGIARTPNTIQSHRLLRFADEQGRQDAVAEALFQAYFLKGRDIGDDRVLAAAAAEGGLDEGQALQFLEGDVYRQEVQAEDMQARQAGITGVPCFIFNGKYALPGAQPPEVIHRMLDTAKQEFAEQPG
jgi:predicted DsbA family dithiol-disulfide isomerase